MNKIAYFDCIGGASGDMLLSCLADINISTQEAIKAGVEKLNLPNCDLYFTKVTHSGFGSTQAKIITPKGETPRHPEELLKIIDKSSLSKSIKIKAKDIILRLATVEAKIHNSSLESIHLHELGGDDTLIDVVGFLAGLENLGVQEIYASTLPLARGQIKSAHGILPLPTPATLALLDGVPVHYIDSVSSELVTPTGAVLLTSVVNAWGNFPTMKLLGQVGVGVGKKEFPFPNIIRVWQGEIKAVAEKLTVLETNIDDMNPQVYGYTMEKLLQEGALDVTFTHIQMKKNRPGVMVSVLCKLEEISRIEETLFTETTTLGIRKYEVERVALPREFKKVATEYGKISVKISKWGNKSQATPEYDECVALARRHKKPLLDIMNAARIAYTKEYGDS